MFLSVLPARAGPRSFHFCQLPGPGLARPVCAGEGPGSVPAAGNHHAEALHHVALSRGNAQAHASLHVRPTLRAAELKAEQTEAVPLRATAPAGGDGSQASGVGEAGADSGKGTSLAVTSIVGTTQGHWRISHSLLPYHTESQAIGVGGPPAPVR